MGLVGVVFKARHGEDSSTRRPPGMVAMKTMRWTHGAMVFSMPARRRSRRGLQAQQAVAGAVGMNGGDAAGMAGIPGLDQRAAPRRRALRRR